MTGKAIFLAFIGFILLQAGFLYIDHALNARWAENVLQEELQKESDRAAMLDLYESDGGRD